MPVACQNCEQPLDERWKFCIRCGAPVSRAATETAYRHRDIPAVFREQDDLVVSKRTFDWQLGLGIVLAIVGVIAIVYLVAVLIAVRG